MMKRFSLGTAVVAAALIAAGCSSGPLGAVSGIFGGDDSDKEGDAPEDENRISILALDETIEADPRFAGATIELPPSYANISWPTPGGEADHTLHHLSTPGTLELVWKQNVAKASSRRARLTSPPVVADGRLYVIDAEATLSAINVEDGEEIWTKKLAPKVKEKFRVRELMSRTKAAELGFGGGVSFDEGKLFVTSGFGFVAAVDAESGEELWRYEAGAPVRTPPTAYRGSVYFVTNTNEMLALKQSNGEREWNFQSFEEAARILSAASPAAAGDLIVAPFSSGEVVAFLAGSGRPVWNDTLARNTQITALSALNDIAGAPVIDRGLVYAVSHAGRLVAIDIRSGQRIWETPIASLQMPWVAGDYIFVVSIDSELVCISRTDGAIAWVSQLKRYENEKKRKGRISWSGPVLAGDFLILVSSDGRIAKVSPQDGSLVETKKIEGGSVVSPIVADERIFVLTQEGKLYAFR